MNNWIEISAPHLQQNFHALQRAAGPATEVLAVIKANAYGHGAELCGRLLAEAGAQWLGVTCAAEGARVRAAAGPSADILIMSGFLPEDVRCIREHHLTPVLWTHDQAAWLSGLPGQRVHVEVDTGMGRQGVLPGHALNTLLSTIAQAGLVLDGIFTHFAASEELNSALTERQQSLFAAAVDQAITAGVRPTWVHAGNTSSVDNPARPVSWLATLAATAGARAMVRSGLALYGYCLPTPQPYLRSQLLPVLTWKACVLAVRDLAPGETVGYSATFTATAPLRVALLPAGYADGLRRELSSGPDPSGHGGWAMLHGHQARILGRISMNLTVVDVTTIPNVQPGDTAILLGPGITADDHARLAHTIAYEILCGIHPCS